MGAFHTLPYGNARPTFRVFGIYCLSFFSLNNTIYFVASMNTFKRRSLSASCFLMLLLPLALQAQDGASDSRARTIFEEVEERRNRITYETSDMRMIIFNARGNTRERLIRSFQYNESAVSKSLLIFAEPANVEGTAFLTLSEGSDEVQKLYLPALGRIQIISASEKSDRFMGSDFTYEDLGDQDPEDYTFEMRAETDTSYVLQARKKDQSQYDHLFFYVHPDRYYLQKVEYFNEEGTMIKRLEASGHREVMQQVWRPVTMVMYDLRNDRKTELSWSNRVINEAIPDWRFTERGLKRGL